MVLQKMLADADVGEILKEGMVDNNEQLIKLLKKAQKQIIVAHLKIL